MQAIGVCYQAGYHRGQLQLNPAGGTLGVSVDYARLSSPFWSMRELGYPSTFHPESWDEGLSRPSLQAKNHSLLAVKAECGEVGRVPGGVCCTGIPQTGSFTWAGTKTALFIAISPLSLVPGTQQNFNKQQTLNNHPAKAQCIWKLHTMPLLAAPSVLVLLFIMYLVLRSLFHLLVLSVYSLPTSVLTEGRRLSPCYMSSRGIEKSSHYYHSSSF